MNLGPRIPSCSLEGVGGGPGGQGGPFSLPRAVAPPFRLQEEADPQKGPAAGGEGQLLSHFPTVTFVTLQALCMVGKKNKRQTILV